MSFTHVFISRPRPESEALAALLRPLGLHTVVQPAFTYQPLDFRSEQTDISEEMDRAGPDTLVIFTSPRAVAHGLPQLPDSLRFRSRIAAIGPATARALAAAGIRVNITPMTGFTSEALLEALEEEKPADNARSSFVFIICAPGGRQALSEKLGKWGWQVHMIMVYRPEPAELDREELRRLGEADGVLSVWTSANAIKALSQRIPPASWYQLCKGDWMVISDRLRRLARAYGPARIHVAPGPGNQELLAAIRNLV